MGQEIVYTIPYNWTPEPHQLRVLESKARFKTIIWHRKARKTTLAINELFRWASIKPGTYWFLSPFYSQTKRNVWDDPEMLSKYLPPGWKRNDSELKVTAPNGSLIYFLGADNPNNLRGPNPYGVIFDEFDDIKLSVWTDVVRPVLAMNKGWAWFMGTPKGQGNLFTFYNRQEEDWQGWILRASESGLFDSKELELAKKELPEAVYKQEMECEFIAGGSMAFKRFKENISWKPWERKDSRYYKLGVDLAKMNDWTVFTPIDLHTWRVGPQERFNQVDYVLVEAKLEAFWRRYNKAKVTIDSTGIGEVVCDHLSARGIPLDRFTFTEESKANLLTNLAVLLEQDLIKLSPDDQLEKELGAMRYEYSGKGKMKMVSPISDDCVMSLALAVHELKSKIPIAGDWEIPELRSTDHIHDAI